MLLSFSADEFDAVSVRPAGANSNWHGGRTRHNAGYVMVRAPGHPRTGRSPYLSEHILVAGRLLSRHPVDGESFHHITVCVTTRGQRILSCGRGHSLAGIRVSDAIEWARTIYERYMADGAPPTMLTRTSEHPWRWRDSNDAKPNRTAPGQRHRADPTCEISRRRWPAAVLAGPTGTPCHRGPHVPVVSWPQGPHQLKLRPDAAHLTAVEHWQGG